MNGVCVRWRGWIDLERLDGVGCLEYNEERAAVEDALLREQIDRYNQRLREFEDKQRGYRGQQDRPDQDLEVSAFLLLLCRNLTARPGIKKFFSLGKQYRLLCICNCLNCFT